MPIFDVPIECSDGESTYTDHKYICAKIWEEAIQIVIQVRGFDDKERFKVFDTNKDGKPYRWEEMPPGWRIFEIMQPVPLRIIAHGLSAPLDINELMSRPVLPLDSKQAEWIWNKSDRFEWWWYMGNYYVFCSYTPGDSNVIYIGKFFDYELKEYHDRLTAGGWSVERMPNLSYKEE